MIPSDLPKTDSRSVSKLLERCSRLCERAEPELENLAEERLAFLGQNLADVLQQLELILRLVDENATESSGREDRHGLLSRVRKDEGDQESGDQPDFDVAQEGLQGNTWTVPMPDLLSFLAFNAKTGVLWVDAVHERFLIGLVRGRLMHATSDQTPDGLRLGEILVDLGHLERDRLDAFLERTGADSGGVSGESFLAAGLVQREQLSEALARQVSSLFKRLIQSKSAVFRFREGMRVALAHQVDMDITALLLDSARAQDEALLQERAAEQGQGPAASDADQVSGAPRAALPEDAGVEVPTTAASDASSEPVEPPRPARWVRWRSSGSGAKF